MPDQLPPAHLLARYREPLLAHLTALYPPDQATTTLAALLQRLAAFLATYERRGDDRHPRLARLTARDAMLITYGDQVREPGRAPLATLHDWLRQHLGDAITCVHLLPFYPYSSDDGFAVIDYTRVDPNLGDWSDIERLSRAYRLMFDAVINHVSAQSAWFQAFLAGDPRYRDWFIVVDEPVDLSLVTRPRTHPLLTRFETAGGAHYVWTTFSADQIDLNFANPEVLLAILDVLLLYVARGASFLRLDAIGYLWKTIGTRCIHLPQTHRVVQLIRTVLDVVAPEVLLITETNVPHRDNISYFGDGRNEAQLVYQFPLAPLVLHAFHSGSTRYLQTWARELATPSAETAFFNFLASHDGIGVQPAIDILSPAELQALVHMTERHGGRVSYKTNSDGSLSAYELNITLMDALSDPATTPEAVAIERLLTANAIMLALAGLPGIYIHSLVGSHNDHEGLHRTGHNRAINRRKWQRQAIDAELAQPHSRAAQVLRRFLHLLRQRGTTPAFAPSAPQTVLDAPDGVFALLRATPDGSEAVVCLHNVTPRAQPVRVQPGAALEARPAVWRDLIGGVRMTPEADGTLAVELPPHAALWLWAGAGRED
ncbi:alpha-amylase family glycosyl hydrolase [Kallotenue papyrolyticum]|uniref:alpha-amylase family glycosyl hydrolase n=1 Tax=Kallotenue papyrolyticum TaxID=1325125 RepID=UPI0004927ABB|nr:alpha-amylase family glycosyl hydrolase [Kallotenue papyrolyticum]